MATSSKWIIGVVIVILIILGYWMFSRSAQAPMTNTAPTVATTTDRSTVTPSVSVVANPSDSSDTAINQDLSNIDAQINSLNTDTTNVDQGLNDKSVQ